MGNLLSGNIKHRLLLPYELFLKPGQRAVIDLTPPCTGVIAEVKVCHKLATRTGISIISWDKDERRLSLLAVNLGNAAVNLLQDEILGEARQAWVWTPA